MQEAILSYKVIKKIVDVATLQEVVKDIEELHRQDNEKYGHALNLRHDHKLILNSLSHESLLNWNIHVWSHFNGQKWDALFIGFIRKSEKFNKKVMDEYIWLSKNPKVGVKLFKIAEDFARKNGCEYMFTSVVENHPLKNKIKSFYEKNSFRKDSELFVKSLVIKS